MTLIEPIDDSRRNLVVAATSVYVRRARHVFDTHFDDVPVRFDLKGRAAGMYRVRRNERVIRYNPYLFAKYFEDNLAATVPHEVAHYITDVVYGLGNIRPHGREWKDLMAAFDADPSRTCSYDMTGIQQRTFKRFAYRCVCSPHDLSSRRHNQISRGKRTYICRRCGEPLALAGQASPG